MKNVRVAEGRTKTSDFTDLQQDFFFFHPPVGEIVYVYSKLGPATLQLHLHLHLDLQQNSMCAEKMEMHRFISIHWAKVGSITHAKANVYTFDHDIHAFLTYYGPHIVHRSLY